ncbi:MAG: TerD family protein [Clostridia bacterium]|nr:TerD family protein [Clostridia bacterium]
MSINLSKGQKIDLTKDNGGLRNVLVGLGWDEVEQKRGFSLFSAPKQDIDCDASVLLCGADGKLVSHAVKDCVVYYGNLRHASGAIYHHGDNLTGAGEGDDEQITVDLNAVPANIAKLVFVVNIYDAAPRHQHFGMIRNAFIRLEDKDARRELCRFNLSENYDGMTGLIVGEIYRRDGNWKFSAIGQPVREASRLDAILNMYR